MTERRLRRAVATLATCCVAMVAAVAPARAQVGATGASQAWAFTYTVGTTSEGQDVQGAAMVCDVRIWKGIAQVVVRSGPMRAITGERGVLLVSASDSALTIVDPQRREVLRAGSGDLAALMSPGQGGVRFDVSEVRSASRARGRGVSLDRYATQRMELDQRYTLQVTAGTMRRTLRNEQVITVDVSQAIERLDPGFRAFAERFAAALGQPREVRAALRAREGRVLRGVPVRTVTAALTISGSDTLRSETTAVLSALRREAVDTTTFRVPADYRVTDVNRLLRPRR